jgi:transposase
LLVGRVVFDGWSIRDAAAAAGVSERTASKWLKRFREEGDDGLEDRCSAPQRVPNRTAPERVEAILALRELRFTAAEIAETLGMAHSTASAVLKRHGKGRLPRPDADQPENRYERARPGELVHVDVKKLGRIAGVGHRITGQRRRGGGAARAGSSCMSASMTAPAWPTSKSSSPNEPTPSARSLSAPLGGSPATASGLSG